MNYAVYDKVQKQKVFLQLSRYNVSGKNANTMDIVHTSQSHKWMIIKVNNRAIKFINGICDSFD